MIRRLVAFHHLLDYSFENRIHEPLALGKETFVFVTTCFLTDSRFTDGTVHHHWMCHFEYTSYTLPDIISLTLDLNDTPFRFSEHIRYILRRCIFALNFCLIENDKIPPNLNARAGKQNRQMSRKIHLSILLGKIVPCNGVNMAKKCVCICDENHSYDPFVAGMLINICPKTDKTIMAYLSE